MESNEIGSTRVLILFLLLLFAANIFSLFSRALLTFLSFYSLLILPWDENRYANRFRLQCVCKILFKWGWITSWSWAVGILDAGTAPSFCCGAKKLLPIVSPYSEGFVMGMIFDPCTPTLCKWVYKRGGVIQLFPQRVCLVPALWFAYLLFCCCCCWIEHKEAMGVMLPVDRIFDECVFSFLWHFTFYSCYLGASKQRGEKYREGPVARLLSYLVISVFWKVTRSHRQQPTPPLVSKRRFCLWTQRMGGRVGVW